MNARAALLLSLPVLLLALACPPAGQGPNGPSDDGGVQILDSGLVDDADGGVPDGGVPDGGGTGQRDGGFSFSDGGFVFDGGFGAYIGEPERGVRCGEGAPPDPCAEGAACCLTIQSWFPFEIEATCSEALDGTCPEEANFTAACDGNEDCEGGICCIIGLEDLQPNTMCLSEAECDAPEAGGDRVCVDHSECPDGQLCCGIEGVTLPVDMGVCRDGCEDP